MLNLDGLPKYLSIIWSDDHAHKLQPDTLVTPATHAQVDESPPVYKT